MWSLGFFTFNLTAGITLPVSDFAALSVAAAIGFIAVGTSRAWGVNSAVIAAARFGVAPETSIDRSSSWRGAVLFASITAIGSFAWIWRSGTVGFAAVMAALGGLLVLSDLPRQTLVIRGRYSRAAVLSAIYAVGSGCTALAVAMGANTVVLLGLWCGVLLATLVLGIGFCGSETTTIRFDNRVAFAWRMTAEAVYLGVGSQIATLLLFLIQDDTATAGIRFAYALVFAPAFVVIQGVQPLVFKHAARISADGPRAVAAVCLKWNLVVTVGLGLCGAIGGVALATVFTGGGPHAAVPYILPVGIAILSAQMFDTALLATRFFLGPEVIHRARLGSVLADVGVQAIGVVAGGAGGLITALVALSIVRAVVSLVVLVWLSSRGETMDISRGVLADRRGVA